MDTQDFLDKLYQVWALTTGAEKRVWVVEKDTPVVSGYFDSEPQVDLWTIYAVDQEERKTPLGSFLEEADADFIATIHGALGDLVRKATEAIDDAERAELQRDTQEGRIFDLELEILGLKGGQ